jgi:hypothetical protein
MALAFSDGFIASRCWDHPDELVRTAYVLTEWKLRPLDEWPGHGQG